MNQSHRSVNPLRAVLTLAACGLAMILLAPAVKAKSKTAPAPEIFFLGDSHLSFGAGKVYRDFFREFETRCKSEETWMGQARAISMRRFALMGVKSTALHTWVTHNRSLKRMVCVPDPEWPVNARLYGFSHRSDGSYVQLGEDPSFPFCRKNKSPLEAVFEWTEPRLLVLYFMGNTIERWADAPTAANRDVATFMHQLPKSTGCVFMTTSPVYRRGDNIEREKAQRNIQAAFNAHGDRCKFVPMLTAQIIAAIQGKAHYFRRHSNGRVKDPYHPGTAAARHLIEIQRRPLCRAVLDALRPALLATVR